MFLVKEGSNRRTLGIVREFLWAYKHFCKIAGGPLGTGLVVAHDGANDNVGMRCRRLYLNFFSSRKISLSS